MDLKRLKEALARWLQAAELDLQSAIRDYDGTRRARRRYRRALEQLRLAEWEAAVLLEQFHKRMG